MTRRHFLLAPSTVSLLSARLHAQGQYPGVAYRDYPRILPDYLRGLAERAYHKRNADLKKLTTTDAVRARQRWARETFWKLAGGMPERTSLNARTTGSFEREHYRVEKIVYESRPGLHIPANLYIPKRGRPPYPGVLFQMGHSLNGKSYESYQRCCQGLVQLGFLVLAFDPMGQGERTYYPRPGGWLTRLGSADDEHSVPGRQMLLAGDTATRMQVWDAVRSLDYLAAHPLADSKRLASTGQSGGGTLTMFLAAVDDRLAAAVVSSGNTENVACAGFIPPGSTDDAEQNFLGSGPLGFDRWDVLYPLAPKPLLVLVSAKDFYGTYSPNYIRSGWEEFQKLRQVYRVLGHADHLAWDDTPLPHTLSLDLRVKVYAWFRRWLLGEMDPVEEPATVVEKDETLWVGPTGNVVRDFSSETPFRLNRARAAAIAPPEKLPDLAELLGAEKPRTPERVAVLGRAKAPSAEIQAIEVGSAPGVWIPAWLLVPRLPDPRRPVLIALEPGGRNLRSARAFYEELAAQGLVVCLPDLRGIGDLRPEFGRGAPHYTGPHQDEENYAWGSLILGKPLVGQRVTDLLGMAAAMRAHEAAKGRRVVAAASGKMTVPAVFAAALDPGIDSLYLAGGLISYRSIVETEEYTHPFANFVQGVLAKTDLPQLAASLAPRRVRLAGAVDAAGKPVDPTEARRIYAQAANVEVVPEAKWTVETFLAL